jgi:hypothetical protein
MDLYTPYGPEILELLERMKLEYGSWRRVCLVSNTKTKVMRNVRGGKRKAISLRWLDRIITSTGIGSVEAFMWFTAEDMVALGIWKPSQYAVGLKRIKGEHVHFGNKEKVEQQEKPKPRKPPPGNVYFDGYGNLREEHRRLK